MTEQKPLRENIPSDFDMARTRVEYKIDPKVRAVSEELEILNRQLKGLNISRLPKILQIKAGKREYTSIRRVESNGISTREIPSESPCFHIIDYKIKADLIDEGQVGVILVPRTLSAEPISRDLIELLESQQSEEERDSGWGTTLPVSLEKRIPFRVNEWEYKSPDFASVKRVQGKLFSQTQTSFFGSKIFSGRRGKQIAIARRVVPDENGMVIVFRNSDWWTKEEIEAQRILDEKFATFYVLVEGGSERQKREAPDNSKQFKTRFSEVIS